MKRITHVNYKYYIIYRNCDKFSYNVNAYNSYSWIDYYYFVFQEFTGSEITLSQVSGIFYVLLGGLVVALAVALLEFCQHGRAEAARANVPLRAALKAKARMATRDRKQQSSSRNSSRDRERLGWNGSAFAGVSILKQSIKLK